MLQHDAIAPLALLPAGDHARVVLVRGDDLVAPLQFHAELHDLQSFAGVARDGDLFGVASEHAGQAPPHGLDAGIEQVAGRLAQQSPHALREIKQLLQATRDQPSDELESQAFARCLVSEDGREGVAAFLEKREPRWTGR